MARILVVGAGVVGVAVGGGVPRLGHDVTLVDVDRERVRGLQRAGYDARTVVRLPDDVPATVFLTVGTPARDGRHDLAALLDATASVGHAIAASGARHTVVVR